MAGEVVNTRAEIDMALHRKPVRRTQDEDVAKVLADFLADAALEAAFIPDNSAADEKGIAFSCPFCDEQYKVDRSLAGRAIKCRHCQQPVRVDALAKPKATPVVRSRPKASPATQASSIVNPSAPASRKPNEDVLAALRDDATNKKDTPVRTVIHDVDPTMLLGQVSFRDFPKWPLLFLAGCLLIAVAIVMKTSLDEDDARQKKLDEASYNFGVALANTNGKFPSEYRKSNKTDKTPVYFFGGLGALAIGLGVVCWAIENKSKQP